MAEVCQDNKMCPMLKWCIQIINGAVLVVDLWVALERVEYEAAAWTEM